MSLAILIELAEASVNLSVSSASKKASFTSFWQSSNVPFTSRAFTFSPRVVNCFSWISLTFPLGYKIVTSMFFDPKKPWATAPPVSPDVATKIWIFCCFLAKKCDINAAINLAPKSLNAIEGPWKSSKLKILSSISSSGASKLMDESTICFKSWSETASPMMAFEIAKAISCILLSSIVSKKEAGSGVNSIGI